MNNCKKCGYYSDGECNICGMGISGEDTFCRLCKDNQNCYYKQLDKLKAKKNKYYQQTLDDEITLNELYQENEQLKALCETYKICYMAKHNDIDGKLFMYQQTLQEIKEIAEEWMKDYCYLDNFKDKEGCCICHENKDCYSYRLLKTLTKAEEE